VAAVAIAQRELSLPVDHAKTKLEIQMSRSNEDKSKRKKAKATEDNPGRLATALHYAAADLWVAPVYGVKDGRCNCGDNDCTKRGEHLRTPNGIDGATKDPVAIEAFGSKWSSSRIAIMTGVEGLIALKVAGKAPQAALAALLSSAVTVQVIDGGTLIYLWRAPDETVPDGGVLLRKGVEVLGRGKYFAAPNDLDTARGERHFAADGVIGQVSIAAAPEWLLASLRPHLLGINPKSLSTGSTHVRFETQAIDVACLIDSNEPIDPAEVQLRALSYKETGPRMPPAVTRVDGESPLYTVLTDRCQVEALKSLGASTIDCIVVEADEGGARVWQISELFNQPQKTVLQRAELAMQCVEIIRRQRGQHAQGRQQPNDKGMSMAERILAVSRRDLGRFEKIDAISAAAKEEARRADLDDNQKALLAIADVSAEKQVAEVLKLKEQYAGGTRNPPAPKSSAPPSAAAATDQEPDDGGDRTDEAEMDAERSTDSAEEVENNADDSEASAESPPTAPEDDGLDIPPIQRRTDLDETRGRLKAIYDKYLAVDWRGTSRVDQWWFVTEVLGVAIVEIGKMETRR
jgi:Bifunctional DNA primase/polymerase, N-terminal